MRIVGILTALAISTAPPSKNAAALERDTRAMATLDCKLLATATKVEAVLDVEREAKIAKEIPKRTRFLLQLLDNQALSTSFWLLRSVTSHFPALLPKTWKCPQPRVCRLRLYTCLSMEMNTTDDYYGH